ncbi:hypothetical protein RJ640_025016, partial [Escallonia rubra]
MTEYGFKNVLSINEYASCFDNIDPLAQYKNWKTGKLVDQHSTLRNNAYLERVQAVFIVSDSVDWSRDIQRCRDDWLFDSRPPLKEGSAAHCSGDAETTRRRRLALQPTTGTEGRLSRSLLRRCRDDSSPTTGSLTVCRLTSVNVLCDILRTGGLPGRENSYQPPLYFAHDDLAYQALFPSERLGMGAFRVGLESIFNRIHPKALEYTTFGKPNPLVFRNAETALMELITSDHDLQLAHTANGGNAIFRALYMIGDNPSVDIKGARQAGNPWFSILTRTGVFKGNENHAKHPAD